MLTKIKYKYNVNILESNNNKQTKQEQEDDTLPHIQEIRDNQKPRSFEGTAGNLGNESLRNSRKIQLMLSHDQAAITRKL